jgi:hypothetical protein
LAEIAGLSPLDCSPDELTSTRWVVAAAATLVLARASPITLITAMHAARVRRLISVHLPFVDLLGESRRRSLSVNT